MSLKLLKSLFQGHWWKDLEKGGVFLFFSFYDVYSVWCSFALAWNTHARQKQKQLSQKAMSRKLHTWTFMINKGSFPWLNWIIFLEAQSFTCSNCVTLFFMFMRLEWNIIYFSLTLPLFFCGCSVFALSPLLFADVLLLMLFECLLLSAHLWFYSSGFSTWHWVPSSPLAFSACAMSALPNPHPQSSEAADSVAWVQGSAWPRLSSVTWG